MFESKHSPLKYTFCYFLLTRIKHNIILFQKIAVATDEYFEMPTKEEIDKKSAINSFDVMNLSKPLIKALSNMGLTTPTEIQVY